ncbi:MAG: hypothetical protein P4L59_10840 [Desulfosporosinus sp.]|nr:hypothetical protein [Desulfosporosinus sp.]
MSIQTTVEIKGVLGTEEKKFYFVRDSGPEAIFGGKTPKELFLLHVYNPGCFDIQEKDIRLNMHVQRQCSFGIAGFQALNVDTEYIQEATEKARELDMKSERQLFVETLDALPNLPEPEALEKIAIDFLCEGNKELAFATADFFEKVIMEMIGEKAGKGSGVVLLTVAAEKAAVRMSAKTKEQN